MKYEIKLICIDVDGTLVDNTKQIPQENLKAIRWAHFEKGVHIAIMSGRIEPSVRHFMEVLGIDEAIPSLGGCIVRDEKGRIIHESFIEEDAALGINDISNELGCTYFYYHHNDWCINPGNEYWMRQEQKATGLTGEVTDLDQRIRKQTPNKILGVNSDPQKVLELKRRIEERYSDKVDCLSSTPQFLEIVPKGVNKGTAVDALCEYYGIERENVMAIGDYYNDVDMFKVAGLSVAMANAPEDIKAMATYSTQADHSHCGVAEAIARFIS